MVKVRYWDTREYQEIDAEGHAERADPEAEYNVVCAGISAITQTLYENLRREEERGQITAEDSAESGHMWIRAWTTDENRDAIRNMFRFTITGLKKMAEDHPENLKVEEERKNGGI